MSTYGGATSINLQGPGLTHWVSTSFSLVSSENTTTSRFFDWNNGSSINADKGVEIRDDNRIYVNSDNNTGNPTHVRVNNGSWGSDVAISNGDTINFSHNGTDILATWVVTTSHLWTSSGPGTLGGVTVQWQGSFSKNPGDDYWRWTVTGYNTNATDYIYLYDYLPTLSSTQPAIGTRTFAASSSSTSQYGLFTPDLTKTYYIINYVSGSSTPEVLATKNFANKKVFGNFW